MATLAAPGTLRERDFTDHVFTCSAGCALAAGTSYFIVAEAARTHGFQWAQNSAGTETNSPAAGGWAIADTTKYRNGDGGAWRDESPAAAKLMTVSYVVPAVGSNVSNLSLTPTEGVNDVTQAYPQAQGFTPDSKADTYRLRDVTLKLKYGSRSSSALEVRLHAAASDGTPGASLATLAGPSNAEVATFTDFVFTCSTGCTLAGGTSYWIVAQAKDSGSSFKWAQNTATTETNTPATATWSIGDLAKYRDGVGGQWTDESPAVVQLMTVSYSEGGDLWVENIRDTSATLTFYGWNGGAWSYSLAPAVHGESCFSPRRADDVHIYLDNLQADTSYTVSAHRGDGCADANRLETEAFSTLTANAVYPFLTASNVTRNSARLTLSGHSGDWWYVETASPSVCTKVTSPTRAVILSSLTSNKSYQYRAYSAAGCRSASVPLTWITDTVSFTTSGTITAAVTDNADVWVTLTVSGITSGKWSTDNVANNNAQTRSTCRTLDHTTTSVVVSGLTAGTAYTFYVYRGSSCAFFDDRIAAQAHTYKLTVGEIGETTATLKLAHYYGSWWHRQDTGGASAQSEATAQLGASCTAAGSGSTANISGLAMGTSYTWNAYDEADCADDSKIASAAFLTQGAVSGEPPATPGSVSVTRSDGTLTASWPSAEGATSYHVTYTFDNGASWSLAALNHPGNSITIGVDNKKTYIVGVRARNEHGDSDWRNSSPAGPYTPPVPPETPASVTVTRADGTLTAAWPSVDGATSYHVTYTSDNGASWSLAALNHPGNSITIGVDNKKTYIVGVRARNEHGDSDWRNSAPAGPYRPPVPPETPSSVTVTRADGSLTASWPAVDGATSYHVTYSGDNGASWTLAALNHPNNSITIGGVDNAKTYIVGVRARNEHGDSDWRNSAPAGPYTDGGTGVAGMSLMQVPSGHLANLSTAPANPPGDAVLVPLLLSAASDPRGRSGLLRIVNGSDRAGAVRIEAFDDGALTHGPLTLDLGAGAEVMLTSDDLELGNPAKGLTGRAGTAATGRWGLQLTSALDIHALAYVRHPDGLLTAVHDMAPVRDGVHLVPTFAPSRGDEPAGLLRLVNPGSTAAHATIHGIDDRGASPGSMVAVEVPAAGAVTLTAQELEAGGAGFDGALGDGTGTWRLQVHSAQPIRAMSLMQAASGHLTNLSTAPDNRHGDALFVPLFLAASDPHGRQGVLRVVNRSGQQGAVHIAVADDSTWEYPPLTLAVGAGAVVALTSDDLELGNPAKGLATGTGPAAAGHWRLSLSSEIDIQALAYIRHSDGLLTTMHDTLPVRDGIHRVPTFAVANDRVPDTLLLRLVTLGAQPGHAILGGLNAGPSSPTVLMAIPAGRSVTVPTETLREDLGAVSPR